MPDTEKFVLTSHLSTVVTRLRNEINSVAAGAGAIDSITIDGTAQTISNKVVALDLSAYAKKTDIAGVYKAKGTVASFSALPSNAQTGDVYNVTAAGGTDENGVAIKAGDNVVKTATGWDNLGGTVDLSNIGLTSDRIRGIQQVADYRTVVVYDNYQALNIYGRPASVVDGDVTLLTNDPIPSGDWGDSSTEGFTTKYGNTVLFLSENDTIDLSYVDPFEVLGINIEEDQSLYVFDDFSNLRVYGNPSEVVIGDDTFSIDYNRKTLTMQETSTTTEEV